VDYKTGRPPGSDDDVSGLQLDIYALAATEVWGKDPNDVTLTYLYLATGEVPPAVANTPQAREECAASAAAMVLDR
ncbi:MAG: PD-(D/E)XK nuclease family protein, partial [Actinomycetota bacterium]